MGQKVNACGLRIGINRGWEANWYASKKDYAKFLGEDIAIRNFLEPKLKDAMLSHIDIARVKTDAEYKVTVSVYVARPGVVIGQDGKKINEVKDNLAKMLKGNNVRVDVVEVKQPDLDANIVAQEIAKQLEERASFRTVQKKAIQRVRKAGAKGIKTSISGRLGGADIARAEGYREGVIPLHTLRSDIDYAHVSAATQYGRLGVKVWICRGEIRPELAKKDEKGE